MPDSRTAAPAKRRPGVTRATRLRILAVAALAVPLGGRFAASAGDEAAVAPAAPPAASNDVPLIVTQLPPGSAAEREGSAGNGLLAASWGDGARIVLVEGGRVVRVLSEGLHSAADPSVAPDGRTVLFAARRRSDSPWAVFETDARSGTPREVVSLPDDLRSPVLLPTVHRIVADPAKGTEPREQIGFVRWLRDGAASPAARAALWTARPDGTSPQGFAFGLAHSLDPAPLADGRVLFSSASFTDGDGPRGATGTLLAAHADGAEPSEFVPTPAGTFRSEPCVVPGPARLVVFVEAAARNWDGSGALASVSLRRNLHSHRTITQPADGLIRGPSPLPDGTVLASRRPADGSGTHAVVRIDPATGRVAPVFDDPGRHDIQARALAASERPDSRSTSIGDPDRAGDEGEGPVPKGEMYGIDVRTSDGLADLAAEAPLSIRLVEGIAPARRAGDVAAARVLGEFPVAADGSWHAVVPADVPVRIQVLGRDGFAVRNSGWIWTRPRGRTGCVGCHEDAEIAPPNRLPEALRAAAADAAPLVAARRRPDFARTVAPIVRERCVSCHGDAAKLRLDGPDPWAQLAAFVEPGRARASRVVWHLAGRNTALPSDGVPAGTSFVPMPAGSAVTAADLRQIAEWIDLGAVREIREDGGSR